MLRVLWFLVALSSVPCFVIAQRSPVDSLKAALGTGVKDTAYVRTLARLAQWYRGKDNEQAVYYARQILQYPDIDVSQTAKTYIVLGLISMEAADPDSAVYFLSKAEELTASHSEDKSLLPVLYNGLGLFHRRQGNNEKALEYYFRIAELDDDIVGSENVAGNLLNISNAYSRMGARREAIRYLYKALPLFEALDHRKGIAYCYNNLGTLQRIQKNFKESEHYLKKSLELKEHEQDRKGIANSCNELAQLYMDLSDFENAASYADRAILIARQLNLQETLVTAQLTKGRMFRQQGRLEDAAAMFEEAKPVAETLPNRYLISTLQSELGKLLSEQNANEMAIPILLKSLEEARLSSNVDALLNAHLFLSQAYSGRRQYKEALDHYQLYHHFDDSVRGKKLLLDYKQLETLYELEKKNAEIAMLKKDQELQSRTVQRQRAVQIGIGIALLSVIVISFLLINRYRLVNRAKRLLEIERVRNTIARDLHDDIGSTVSSINIVSRIAMQQVNGVSGAQFKRIADHSTALMERMSDIVWSINPINDSMEMMVARMKEFTAEVLEPGNIDYTFLSTDLLNNETLDVEKRRNLFMIFKEAVNNAAKYSGATTIRIDLTKKGKTLRLEVADNGKGFEPDVARSGNGLRNMEARARAVNGRFKIRSNQMQGTQVSVEFDIT